MYHKKVVPLQAFTNRKYGKKVNTTHRLKIFYTIATLLLSAVVYAQNESKPILNTLRFETRFDYDYQSFENDSEPILGGFSGKYINVAMAGNITDRFSYNYRQRILPNKGLSSLFDGTDWIYLTYDITNNLSISGGKQVSQIGGFEYDMPPIDVYFWSDFWNNIICYQMGASLTYTDDSKNHNITFQFANSNYTYEPLENLYAYNLIWFGNFEHFKTIYSVNMVEYSKGKYINYIALGNKLVLDNFSCYIDLMNRATNKQDKFFGEDYTVIGKMEWQPNEQWNLFAKGGYDANNTQTMDENGNPIVVSPHEYLDIFVTPGTEYHYYGVGAEYFPLKDNKDIRLHTFVAVKNDGSNELHFNMGLTWRVNFMKYIKL